MPARADRLEGELKVAGAMLAVYGPNENCKPEWPLRSQSQMLLSHACDATWCCNWRRAFAPLGWCRG